MGIGKILASAGSHRLMFQTDLPAGICGSYVLHQSAAQSRHLAQLAETMTGLTRSPRAGRADARRDERGKPVMAPCSSQTDTL
jgi:hypothetical protein